MITENIQILQEAVRVVLLFVHYSNIFNPLMLNDL
jgi:hypothetical protein